MINPQQASLYLNFSSNFVILKMENRTLCRPILSVIASLTKFSILIGSARAYHVGQNTWFQIGYL